MSHTRRVSIYTDGSCKPNPGVGGYCAIIRTRGRNRIITGHVRNSSVNKMELKAVIEGLSAITPGSAVTVFTDSQYVEDAFNKGRLKQWQENGWKRIRTGQPVQNKDQWMVLSDLIQNRNLDVQFVKLKAHKANIFNNCADLLAKQAAQSA